MMTRAVSWVVALTAVAGLLLGSAGCAGAEGAPAGSGPSDVLWVGDAETGDLSQFQDGPWNDVGGLKPRIVSNPVRDGRYAIALTLTGATGPGDGICCGSRNELLPRFPDLKEGDEFYFAFSTYLASDFPLDGGWQVITQFKQNFDGSPPLLLNVEEDQYRLEGGYGYPGGSRLFIHPLGTARTGVWEDWVLHVRFSADPNIGFVEVWRNGDMVQPRFQPAGGTLYPGTGDRAGSYLKTGPYRDPTISVPSTMYLDDWRIGTSYDAVTRPPPRPSSG